MTDSVEVRSGPLGVGFAGADGLTWLISELLVGFRIGGATSLMAVGAAFFNDRIVFPGSGLLGGDELAAEPWRNRPRMRFASSSLMELLWLLAAIESFSAAWSTSLFSRPRSLDSS